jgi:hypothetical protein
MDMREGSNDYHAVVAHLNEQWRVIDSCESYPYRQWILQERGGKTWRNRSFCQNRGTLQRDVREKVGNTGEEAQRILNSLPDRDLGKERAR